MRNASGFKLFPKLVHRKGYMPQKVLKCCVGIIWKESCKALRRAGPNKKHDCWLTGQEDTTMTTSPVPRRMYTVQWHSLADNWLGTGCNEAVELGDKVSFLGLGCQHWQWFMHLIRGIQSLMKNVQDPFSQCHDVWVRVWTPYQIFEYFVSSFLY